jgi:putative peptidoglycan lipid II flippase
MSGPAPAKRGLGRAAAVVSAATMLSRVLAVIREQLYAALFGSSMYADAYRVGFRIPNLLRDLFAEGALSAAFVPTFTDRLQKEGRESAFRLANLVIGAVLVVVGGLMLAGLAAAPQVVHLLAQGYEDVPGKFELTVTLTRLMFPFLPLVSLAAVVMGQLNSQERFGVPALASASFNLVAILAGVALHIAKLDPRAAVVGWSLATVVGGLVQVLVQVPSLVSTGFRSRPSIDFKDAGLRRIGALMLPATIGLAAVQINVTVNTRFAATVPGAVTWLDVGFRLMQLPIGIFGVAVGTIATTRLAQQAAAGRGDELAATLSHGLRLVAFLTVPCTAGLVALAAPIIRLIYQHGAFTAADTEHTAGALVLYATGLFCYSAVKVAAPAFYALGRPRLPLAASLSAVAANLIFNLGLFRVLSYPGLALGTALAATVNFAVLAVAFHRSAAALDLRALGGHFVRVCAAAAACGCAAWIVTALLESSIGVAGFGARAAGVGAGMTAGVLAYALACRLLGVAEWADLAANLRRRFGRG